MAIPTPNEGEKKEDFIKRFMSDEKMKSEFPDDNERLAIANKKFDEKSFEDVQEDSINYEMETVDLNNVAIFSTGKWEGKGSAKGGDNITESTLDSWVDSFKKIGSKIKPRMRITHDPSVSKSILNTASLGWITDLKRNGNELLADFKSVPRKVANLIEKKAFGRFSPGIYDTINVNGNNFNNVLEHVALLGADLPANMDLDGFIDLYSTDYDLNELKYYVNKIDVKDNIMPDIKTFEKEYKDSQDLIIEKDLEIKNYESKIEVLDSKTKELEKENSDLKADIEKTQYESKQELVKFYLDEKVKEKKITPAQIPHYFGMAMNGNKMEYSYIEGDKQKTIEGDGFEFVKGILDNASEIAEFSNVEESDHTEKDKAKQFENKTEDDILDEKVKEYMKENDGVTYVDALREINYQEEDE